MGKRLSAALDYLGFTEPRTETSYTTSGFTLADYVQWMVNGVTYTGPTTTLSSKQEPIGNAFESVVNQAYKQDGVVFAVELARMSVFSEARFQWQSLNGGRPGDLFGTPDLALLERPWKNATTGDLLARMLLNADFAGNAYVYRAPGSGRLRLLRPDWTAILLGSQEDTEDPGEALDAEVIGYQYKSPRMTQAKILLPSEVAHFAPVPDPMANFRGMSWLTPILREVQGDKAATEHKVKFFENGATANMVVKMDPALTVEQVNDFAELFKAGHEGLANAYKTLFLGGGADVQVVGADLRQLEFKATQGAGETRIAAAGGVPPVIVGLSEGLASATYSNYGQARRRFADGTLRPLWRNAAASLEAILPAPSNSRLWYDDRDIAFLREDQKDAADIRQTNATTLQALVNAGYDPDSAVKAVLSGDLGMLVHTGLYSVQLQPPGITAPAVGGST